jgi:hypothetical protein
MKKLIGLFVVVVLAVYGIGLVRLGEFGAMRFVGEWETLGMDGKADEVCALLHEDLEVDVLDHTLESEVHLTGGRQEFCEFTRASIAGLQKIPHSMHVQRDEVVVKRDWLHPWTSEVSYNESRSMTLQGLNLTLNTVSEDSVTLVQTFSGVKVRRIKAEVWKED